MQLNDAKAICVSGNQCTSPCGDKRPYTAPAFRLLTAAEVEAKLKAHALQEKQRSRDSAELTAGPPKQRRIAMPSAKAQFNPDERRSASTFSRLEMHMRWRLIELATKLHWMRPGAADKAHQSQELEQLAHAITEYAGMRRFSAEEYLAVEIGELMFSFRETRQTITEALELLKTQGQADGTRIREIWKINVSRFEVKPVSGNTVWLFSWKNSATRAGRIA